VIDAFQSHPYLLIDSPNLVRYIDLSCLFPALFEGTRTLLEHV
jgi:hypothetical protein